MLAIICSLFVLISLQIVCNHWNTVWLWYPSSSLAEEGSADQNLSPTVRIQVAATQVFILFPSLYFTLLAQARRFLSLEYFLNDQICRFFLITKNEWKHVYEWSQGVFSYWIIESFVEPVMFCDFKHENIHL